MRTRTIKTAKTALRNLHGRYRMRGERLAHAVESGDGDEQRRATRLVEQTLAAIRQMHRR